MWIFCGLFCAAQNNPFLYGLNEIPQSLLLNPGGQFEAGQHVGIPFGSHLFVDGASQGVGFFDLLQGDAGDLETKLREKVNQMNPGDFLTVNQSLEFMNFGWRRLGDTYYTAGLYQEVNIDLRIPEESVELPMVLKTNNPIEIPLDIGNASGNIDLLLVFHFAINKEFNEKWTLGFRAKLYSSILNMRSRSMVSNANRPFLSGAFSPETDGISVFRTNFQLRSAGANLFAENPSAAKLLERGLLNSSLGPGLDLGFSFRPSAQWEFTGSALGLGGVFYLRDTQRVNLMNEFGLAGDKELIPFEFEQEHGKTSYFLWRPIKLNTAVNYQFEPYYSANRCNCSKEQNKDYTQGLGLQVYGLFHDQRVEGAVTIQYQNWLSDALLLKGTYTIDSFTPANVGVGFLTNVSVFSLHFSAQNLLEFGDLEKARGLSFQLGANILLEKPPR